jgi:hypothetical protein
MARDSLIDDWSEWTGEAVVDRHHCARLESTEIGILRRTTGATGAAGWILARIDPATEDDVRKGVAPELGVPARCTALEIAFCPFCGLALQTSPLGSSSSRLTKCLRPRLFVDPSSSYQG